MMRTNTVETYMGTWGIVLKPNVKHNVVFDQPFHLKRAVLDFKGHVKEEFHFRVILQDNNDDCLPLTVCILNKANTLQTPLDLVFEKGDDVTFSIKTDLYNLDANSFTVHLSGVSTRDETFERRLTCPKKPNLDQLKLRTGSLPDEYFQKKGLPSPLKKHSTPVDDKSTSTSTPVTPTSPSGKLLVSESAFSSEPNSPKSKEDPTKREVSHKSSFRGDVMGKLGKFLTKS